MIKGCFILETNAEYRTIGQLFGVSKSRVGEICEEFCYVTFSKLLPKYFKIPLGENLELTVKEFQLRRGFPHCFGAIDGFHIPIKAPVDFHADYYNRKSWYAIILLAIVDSSGPHSKLSNFFFEFMTIFAGFLGHNLSIHYSFQLLQGACQIWKMDFPDTSMTNIPLP